MKRIFYLIAAIIPTILMAQDLIIPKQGDPITAYELNISDTYLFYSESTDADAPIRKIAKENVAVVRKADGTIFNLAEAVPATPVAEVAEQPDRFPIVDLSQYHGYLLQKGNCVYIPTDSKREFERAGQEEFKRLMEERGYWQVVDKPEQAHFVAIYYTDLAWDDCIRLYFRMRNEYEKSKSVVVNKKYENFSTIKSDIYVSTVIYPSDAESIEGNIKAANTLMYSAENFYASRWKWAEILQGKIRGCCEPKAWTIQ